MKQIALKFLVNIFAVFLLSFLLLGSIAFSATVVTFNKSQILSFKYEDYRFGDFLKIKKESYKDFKFYFDIAFIALPKKPALYRDFLKLTNSSNNVKIVKILNSNNPQADVFFTENYLSAEGAKTMTLKPGQILAISLIARPAVGLLNEEINTSFTLEVE